MKINIKDIMSWFTDIFRKVLNNEGIRQEPIKEVEIPVDLNVMTKKQLEEYGRGLGIELDRRHTKKKLIATLEALNK
jgi:hypothetical protein